MSQHAISGLGLRVWRSAGAARTVVIHPALGVKQRFYRHYADFLATQGLNVVTFDYRGVGESKVDWRATTLSDWAQKDQKTALGWAKDEFALPISAVGHSIGAQLLGLLEPRDRSGVDRLLTVSSMNNELEYSRQNRLAMRAFWAVGVPALCRAAGRFPAKSMGLFEDVPSGVMMEWRAWVLGGSPFEKIADPPASVASLSFADDEYGDFGAVRAFHDAVFDRVTFLRPEAKKVGHHGFFKPANEALWRDVHAHVAAETQATKEARS